MLSSSSRNRADVEPVFTSTEAAGSALSWTAGVDATEVPGKTLLDAALLDVCESDSGKPTAKSVDAGGVSTGAPVWGTMQGWGNVLHCQEIVGETLCMTRAAKQRWSAERDAIVSGSQAGR